MMPKIEQFASSEEDKKMVDILKGALESPNPPGVIAIPPDAGFSEATELVRSYALSGALTIKKETQSPDGGVVFTVSYPEKQKGGGVE